MTLLTFSALTFVGKEQYIYALESLSSNGTFWARVHKPGEEDQRFIDAMARMGLVGFCALHFSNPCLIYKAKAVPSSSVFSTLILVFATDLNRNPSLCRLGPVCF